MLEPPETSEEQMETGAFFFMTSKSYHTLVRKN